MLIFLCPNHIEAIIEYLNNYIDTGIKKIIGIGRELEIYDKNGKKMSIDLAVSEFKIDDKQMFAGIVRNITDRKNAEISLKQSRDYLRKAQELANVGNWVWDFNKNESTWSEQTYIIFGYKPNEIQNVIGLLEKHLHPDDFDTIIQMF